jgi:hypothetical protein
VLEEKRIRRQFALLAFNFSTYKPLREHLQHFLEVGLFDEVQAGVGA